MPDNPDFDWLTYETEFNQGRFRRPRGQFETHLYCLPRNEVIVWFRDGIDDDTVKALSAAFFPDEAAPLVHRDDSAGAWPWKEKGERRMPPATPLETPLRIGPGALLHAPGRVVLPYNELDNDEESLALGTGLFTLPLHGRDQDVHAPVPRRRSPRPDLLRPELHWKTWRTASRSSVMRLAPLAGSWPGRWRDPPAAWSLPLDEGESRRAAAWALGWRRGDKPVRLRDGRAANETAHHLAEEQLRHDFSVKTGVSFVGREFQQDKQRMDGNWIVACLRSDYLDHMEKAAPRPDPDLVFVTELLTIAEREERPQYDGGKWQKWQRDGVQVRDLAPLLEGAKAGKLYFPPLSIPFVGCEASGAIDFATRTDEFRYLGDDGWSDFWKAAWASLLGRAKALLLVRYALQSINPHVQNFLLEFGRPRAGAPWTSTGRLIVRDMQDTAIHREAAWALHGKWREVEPPVEPDDPANPEHPLCDEFALEVLNHEFGPARECAQETGTRIGEHYNYLGTHLLWRLFSQFGKYDGFHLVGERIYQEGNTGTVEWLVGPRPPPAAADAGGGDELARRVAAMQARKRAERAEEERKKTFSNRFGHWLAFRMAEWGLAHNRAFLHALEEALGHNFCVDWKNLTDPQRPTGSAEEGAAAPLAGGAAAWEDQASALVHEHLRTLDGQRQIRAYRERKWKAVPPALELRVTSRGAPCPYRKIALKRLGPNRSAWKEWVELTDDQGKVFLYQASAADFRYRFDLERGLWSALPPPGADGTYDLDVEAPRPVARAAAALGLR